MVWGCIGLPPDGPDEEPASFVSPMVNSLNPKAQREQKEKQRKVAQQDNFEELKPTEVKVGDVVLYSYHGPPPKEYHLPYGLGVVVGVDKEKDKGFESTIEVQDYMPNMRKIHLKSLQAAWKTGWWLTKKRESRHDMPMSCVELAGDTSAFISSGALGQQWLRRIARLKKSGYTVQARQSNTTKSKFDPKASDPTVAPKHGPAPGTKKPTNKPAAPTKKKRDGYGL
jgi:hypothetical protein